MKILHLNDQAGVSCVLAKYQNKLGNDTKVIKVSDDKYGIYEYYRNYVQLVRQDEFIEKSLQEAKHYDIIHVHSLFGMIFYLRKKYGTSKKIILHYHGTDIRGIDNFDQRKRAFNENLLLLILKIIKNKKRQKKINRIAAHRLAQILSDNVLISQKDLSIYGKNAKYIPIPIDLDHFYKHENPNKRKALLFKTEASNMKKTLETISNNFNFSAEVHDRISNPIKYSKMPEFLNQYEIYVDIRFIKELLLEDLSTTSLQSLACGLKVITPQLKILDTFPLQHNPTQIVDRLLALYKQKQKSSLRIQIISNLLKATYQI
jgi:glycosyltransferase involved in cell wall biosynthesis